MWLEEAAEWATWARGCHNPESTSAGAPRRSRRDNQPPPTFGPARRRGHGPPYEQPEVEPQFSHL